jgi:uncharacterized protein
MIDKISGEEAFSEKLSRDDSFCFSCGPHVKCFTECCGKLQLLLTPYDVLRLRRNLGITSEELLDRFTVMRRKTPHGLPEIYMQMDPEKNKRCPFVTESGCSVYSDRPGACRIYPIGRASSTHPMDGSRREFFFVVKEDHCMGFLEDRQWSIAEWMADQELVEYNRMNDLLMEIYSRKIRRSDINLTPQHLQMFVMACYNTEKFRNFLFAGPFFDKFAVDPVLKERLAFDDMALLEFAFLWLRFALLSEPVLEIL